MKLRNALAGPFAWRLGAPPSSPAFPIESERPDDRRKGLPFLDSTQASHAKDELKVNLGRN
jgi:hypothetical protein